MIKHAYMHIPFCLRKCKYCDFVSGKDLKNKEIYLKALLSEIKKSYKNDVLKTLYFGGGTPSLLKADEIKLIFDCFKLEENAEITLEANPETVELEKFIEYRKIGINRISLGVQSFDNNLLQLIGRNHREETIIQAIKTIKKAGFENISIDLIYGLPNQTIDAFKLDLEKAMHFDIQHISTYGLKIEENSYFGKNPPDNLPNDEVQAEMFLYLCDFLKENNFEHYEISNFAKKGHFSKHNCAYWKNKEYYGFGLNASGYTNDIRYKNNSDFDKYITKPTQREEEDFVEQVEKLENEIFLALRLKEGVDIEDINAKYNINFEQKYKKIIAKYSHLNLLEIIDNRCKLTEKGILLSNDIMSEFLD